MPQNLISKSTITIHADTNIVWDALTDPAKIEKYMFGAKVESDWSVGSPIYWRGELDGKKYEDKGEILEFSPNRVLAYSHYSSLSGKPDSPENYHNVVVSIENDNDASHVTLTQDNNPSESARKHSQENWAMMLRGLKKVAEGG